MLKKFQNFDKKYHTQIFEKSEDLAKILWKNGELVDNTIFNRIYKIYTKNISHYKWLESSNNNYMKNDNRNWQIIKLYLNTHAH